MQITSTSPKGTSNRQLAYGSPTIRRVGSHGIIEIKAANGNRIKIRIEASEIAKLA